ncbi:hypothetical protein ERO13_A09G118200v2 [Gossypium hirsutum]|uniref:Vacuolar amino acid transporter YPQ3 n=3 Tax=Gossypium TaxID=3633 RepID=A0A5D2XX32_GOSMU|nr:probable vacuolar amino acid transporter YPQ3 [Gossypium hirsutum]KAG4183588.1 hypothetical protein ERO13_A09G118200v2 [Gossypium hirsutum]TYI10450.1 hypothetical protein ES332_A09G142000v1 [Gossypium tomentosum]TYJ18504.1 hypothetical protein E1A91_A09G128300v1 [Gossypium mustelinum]
MATCGTSGECWEWARVYLDDCICSPRDQVSFGLGLISVLSWGVAEIPQIITNYKEKSVEGLSLGFLITWIIGDLFNLFGCVLEPATLPTQYYMAVLYTMTTLILAAQAVYYGHIYPRLKYNNMCNKDSKEYQPEGVDKIGKSISNFRVKQLTDVDRSSSPIPLPKSSPGRELYYRSARSLSSSHTPTAGSLLAQRMTSPHSGNLVEEPLLSAYVAKQSTPPSSTKSLLCLVSAVMFISLFNFQLSAVSKVYIGNEKINQGFVIKTGRKLLQANAVSLGDNGFEGGSKVGTFLGWAMAAIYMGGRLPQICLNIERGNVEGLNPFMFIFALVGNSTYVASILVRSMDWFRIRPNLPWLVDAGGCVLLDTFIVIQFIYFYKWAPQDSEDKHGTS